MTKLSFPILLLSTAVFWGCTEARTDDLKPPTPVKVQAVQAYSPNTGLRYSATIRPVLNTGQSVAMERFMRFSQPRGRPSLPRV